MSIACLCWFRVESSDVPKLGYLKASLKVSCRLIGQQGCHVFFANHSSGLKCAGACGLLAVFWLPCSDCKIVCTGEFSSTGLEWAICIAGLFPLEGNSDPIVALVIGDVLGDIFVCCQVCALLVHVTLPLPSFCFAYVIHPSAAKFVLPLCWSPIRCQVCAWLVCVVFETLFGLFAYIVLDHEHVYPVNVKT